MKLDDGRLTFVAQQEVTALDAIHKAVLGKAACAGRVTEGVGTCISIHAPTWGATASIKRTRAMSIISIHAPTWGATFRDFQDARATIFQSTHPRGVRQDSAHAKAELWDFNPRTHVGCDIIPWHCSLRILLFQSTHPRGVRLRKQMSYERRRSFQSTHPRGVRPFEAAMAWLFNPISIHAPTWGATETAR